MKQTKLPSWFPNLSAAVGPAYLAIADAIAKGIATGELPSGAKLPTQRSFAQALGVDFTTVSRAYAEASARGLIEGQIGRGTYVLAPTGGAVLNGYSNPPILDLSINHPPPIDEPLLQRIWRDLDQSGQWLGRQRFQSYPPSEGYLQDRAAGAQWLSSNVTDVVAENTLVCGGTQCALLAITNLLAMPGQAVCVDEVTYIGFKMLALRLGIRLLPISMDQDGMVPDRLAEACQDQNPQAIYCMPTLQNPTTITMPLERRTAIAKVARRFNVPIIEDDNYWPLLGPLRRRGLDPLRLPALAELAPELVFHVSGLSKCLSPALRITYVRTPDKRHFDRLTAIVRATSTAASPFTAALATRWIREGTAAEITAAIAREGVRRQEIAVQRIGRYMAPGDRRGFHAWIPLPHHWSRSAFIGQLRRSGILVTESDSFAVTTPPEAVRLCLGGVTNDDSLRQALDRIDELLSNPEYQSGGLV